MKKLLVCICLMLLITSFNFVSYAEVNTDYFIGNVTMLQDEEYGRFMKAQVYGFEETDELSLRVGDLKNPDKSLVDKITKHLTKNDKFVFVELTAYDVIDDSKVVINNPINMQVTFDRRHFGTNYIGYMGKDYRVLRIDNDIEELSVTQSSWYTVTFETDKLGIFAVIYDPYAINLSFMLDDETQYSYLENLAPSSVINLPDPPQKEGHVFVGWCQRENGQGKRLYPGIDVSEAAYNSFYAYWVEASDETLMTDMIYDEAFGQNDVSLVELSLGADNGKKIIFAGDKELYYNEKRDLYIGLVDSSTVSGDNNLSSVTMIDREPVYYVYGNLVDNSSDQANVSDLHAMKLIIENNMIHDDRFLIASDLNDDGQCNITDLQAMKLYIKSGRQFPVLN